MDKERLTELRQEINLLDNALLDLLQKRAYLSKEVAKAKNGSTIFYPAREREIIARLQERNQNPGNERYGTGDNVKKHALPNQSIAHIWTEIFSCSRSLQRETRLAFLGPMGTFSHFAGQELMGKSLEFVPCHDFAEIFQKVHNGEVSCGLVPVENSLQGTIGQSLDLFEEYPVHIVAEHYSVICQCLLSKEKDMQDIEVIYSHPQALMQSSGFIRKNCPHARLVELSSTAEAASRALQEERAGAIGHERLAEFAGGTGLAKNHVENTGDTDKILHVLAKDIASSKANTTRFVLIAKERSNGMFKKAKSSFTFTVVDKAGALSEVLQIIQRDNVNLSKLESRPLCHNAQGTAWQYRFFADAEANLWEKAELVQAVKAYCHDIRILGVYESVL